MLSQAYEGVTTVGAVGVAWNAVGLDSGWLCWLMPQPAISEQRAGELSFKAAPDAGAGRRSLAVDFELALELASISVWKIDLPSRRIYYNNAGYRLTGIPYQRDGMRLDEVRALTHPDDVAAMVRAFDEAVAGPGVIDVEGRYRNPDGSYRHLLTRRAAQRDPQGQVVALVGVSIDQTEQIAARERARTLTERIDTVADAAGVGIWIVDTASGGLQWNRQMLHMHGASAPPPSSLREWALQCVHPDDRATILGLDAGPHGAAALADQFDGEFRIVRDDGSVRWLQGRALRETRDGREWLLGIALDVTERHAVNAELELQRERLAMATRAAGMGVWERDLAGAVRYWDEQMYRLRGLDPADPRTLAELTAAGTDRDDLQAFLRESQRHLETGAPYLREFRVRWPDGSEHWVMSAGTAVRDAHGRATRLTGVNWDITQRRQAEQALRDKAIAETASRAKSEFLARMSHELRTPLNAVLGFAQLIGMDASHPLPAPQRARVERIGSAASHLLSLIEDVLDLASIEAGGLPVTLEPVEVDAALEDVLHWLGPLAESRAIRLHAPPTHACVHADPRRLRQVLLNLLSNAVKYNRVGGEVWVDAQELPGDIAHRFCLSVRDSGRGLTPLQLEHLFEPFNRLGAEHDAIEGVGIGLVIVRRLVDLMGGTIEATSTPGEGAEFRICFASAERSTRPPAPLATRAGGLDSRRPHPATPLNILYIEDNAVNVILVQELVAMRGRDRLHCAADGISGVTAAQTEAFDLILVDLQLPDIDGYEVQRRLRAQAPPPSGRRLVVALSAHATPEDMRAAIAGGFDDYWTKPIDFKRFLGALDQIAADTSTTT